MKKMMIVLLAMVAFCFFSAVSVFAEQQKIVFALRPYQEVQKYINFRFTAPSWGCATYEFEQSFPFFDRKGRWKEVLPGHQTEYMSGFYRFVSGNNSCEVIIIGEVRDFNGYLDDMGFLLDYQDASLFIKDSWTPFDIGLMPLNGLAGTYDYSYFWLCPGWGRSVYVPDADKLGYSTGKYVGVALFNSAGFLKKVLPIESKELVDEWVNPGEIALLIYYEGQNWKREKRNFLNSLKKVNQNLRMLAVPMF